MNECYPPAPGHDPKELSCEGYHHRHPIDRAAPDCDDQLPTISNVGRGPQGYGYKVEISDPDTCTETYLEGFLYDPVSGEYKSEWKSENINGGELSYQYNLRPHTIPRTFTVTFIYRRPGRCEWSWTTPAIPYVWTLDPAGKPDEDPDHVVGSGIATLLVKTCHEGDWNYEPTPDGFDKETGHSHHERLWYPMGPDGERTTRDQFNAPLAEEGWSATLVFGRGNGEMGGTIDVPDFDDLARFLGQDKETILYAILDKMKKDGTETTPTTFPDGIQAYNYTDWILKHVHKDMGWWNQDEDHWKPGTGFGDGHNKGHENGEFSGDLPYQCDNIKDYIDWAIYHAIKNMSTPGDSKYNNLLPKPVRYVSNDDTAGSTASDVTYDKQLTDENVKSGGYELNVNGGGVVSAKWVVIRSETGIALAKVSITNNMSTGVTFNISFDMKGLKCYEDVTDSEGHSLKGTTLPSGTYPAWQCGMSRGDGTTWIRDFSGSINGSCPDGSVSGSCYIPYTNNCTGGNYADLVVDGVRSGATAVGTLTCQGHLDAGPNNQINLTVPYFFGNY